MSRLFISHSSLNNDRAIEVRDWLAKNGWDDIFLDLDPERGIVAGQRWKEALQKAAYRCEVVLALVSKEWLGSGWCKSEVDAARLMGKKVIVALVGVDKSAVPLDLTDEQFIDLTGDPQAYRRLKEGLKRAGLDPTTFPFEAGRRPYPGFAYLEEDDAAVFFGRDAQIVRGLDEIRRLARTGVTRMFVILGASGSGKSSFLRAGLWSRLKRDDLAWLPLPIVRPERAAISGTYGLAAALYQIAGDPRFSDGVRQRGLPRSRVDILDFVEKTDDGLAKLLAALRDIAQAGFSSDNAAPPTILLAIDQGEELFNEEGRDEAKHLIDILTKTLAADPRTMAILVMRSDAFPLLQNDPAFAALPKDTFTLDMMLEGSFRAVIEGPTRLVEPPLAIDPQLTDALLEDVSGQDALPLLAFTLAHLYDNTRVDDALALAGYDKIGRVKGVIDKTVAQAFAEAVARGEAPKDQKEQLKLARSAFIPHLAQVNPAGQFVRRVAPRNKIPDEARPLIDRFAEQRLLIRDRRQDAEVIEVAHEALLRQPPFSDWLAEDREFLLWRDRLTQARTAFGADERGFLAGRELSIARSYMQTRAERDFEPADLAFIRESIAADDKRRAEEAEQARAKEIAEREEQERRVRDAERIAAEQKKAAAAGKRTAQVAVVGLVVALLVAAAAVWQYFQAQEQKAEAEKQTRLAVQQLERAQTEEGRSWIERSKLNSSLGNHFAAALMAARAVGFVGYGREKISDAKFNEDYPVLLRSGNGATDEMEARRQISEASSVIHFGLPLWQSPLFLQHADSVLSVAWSPDGKTVASGSLDKTVKLWDVPSGKLLTTLEGHAGGVSSVAWSPDGKTVASGSFDNTVKLWETSSGMLLTTLKGHADSVLSVAWSPDGKTVASGSLDKTVKLWDVPSGKLLTTLEGHVGGVSSVAWSPDGKTVASGSFGASRVASTATPVDNTVKLWETSSGMLLTTLEGHAGRVLSVAWSPDGKMVASGFEDKTVKLWETSSGKLLTTLKGHTGSVRSVAWSPDGKTVASGSYDNTVKLWETSSGKLLRFFADCAAKKWPLRGSKSNDLRHKKYLWRSEG